MSEIPDHERVRRLMAELEALHRDSEDIRRRIDEIRNSESEWPNSPVSGPIGQSPNSSESESKSRR
jgi:hypothetical protein